MNEKSILLLNFPHPTLRGLFPDNGLALLAACLIEEGIKPKILDYCTVDRLKSLKSKDGEKELDQIVNEISTEIDNNNIRHVGVKLWMNAFDDSLYISKKLRQTFGNKLTLIGGGPQVDYFWDYFDEYNYLYDAGKGLFDAVVFNEGELTLPKLVKAKREEWNKIPNLVYKKNGKVINTGTERVKDLDSLPFANYDPDVYPAMEGNNKIKFIYVRVNWGCLYGKCNFCFHPIKSGKKFKEIGKLRVLSEIKHYVDKYNVHTVRFGSSTSSRFINELAKEIINSGLKITYSMFGNINFGHKYNFDLLKKSGCESIFYGAESGNQQELDWFKKGTRVEQTGKVVKATKDAGIKPMLSFIHLGDDNATEDTIELIRKVRPTAMSILPLIVIPKTPLANDLPSNLELSENYFKDYMHLKINLTRPIEEWMTLKLKLNGKSMLDLEHEVRDITIMLEKEGIPSRMSDETFVVAKQVGMSAVEVRDFERKIENPLCYDEVKRFVTKFNEQD